MLDVEIGRSLKLAALTPQERWCHVAGVLAIAAKAPVRGRLLVGEIEADHRHVAKQADVPLKIAKSTLEKLRTLGIVIEDPDLGCEQVHDFEEWNPPPKHDATNADRQARYRQRRNARRNGAATVTRVASNALEVEVEGKRREELRLGGAMSEEGFVEPPPLPRLKGITGRDAA